MKKTKKLIAILLLVVILFSMNIASVFAADYAGGNEPKVYSEGINTLNLLGEFVADGNDGAIWVKDGAKLTINGTDSTKVQAALGVDNYSMALWAKGESTKVVINGGYYTNKTDGSERGTDLIYASDKAVIEINGGTFKAATPKWTLNLHDSKVAEIVVKGGTFYKFNPAEAETEPGGKFNFVAPGYSVVKNGDWYSVYEAPKVYSEGINTLNLLGEFIADGNDGAIWVKDGAKLTINGTDSTKVQAALGVDNYSMALWAKGESTKVVINGGYYTNKTDGSERGTDLIYASDKAVIEINGGTFKAATPKWTLNLHDSKVAEIVVKGGTFYKFNPAEAETEPGGKFNFVAPGYRVIKDGDWYSVCEIKETEAEVSNSVANKEEVKELVMETLKEAVAADPELAKEIEGKSIEVEVKVKPVDVNKSEKETIETEAAKKVENIKVAEYIDISIVVKDADTDEEITKLSTVKEVIKFTVEVPSEFKTDIPEGYTRIYYIIRNHNGVVDVFETAEVDGKLIFESDKFSTYAIAYKDIKEESTTPPADEGEEDDSIVTPPTSEGEAEKEPEVEPEVKPDLPDPVPTGDNVVIYAVFAVAAILGMVVVIRVRKK